MTAWGTQRGGGRSRIVLQERKNECLFKPSDGDDVIGVIKCRGGPKESFVRFNVHT